MIDIKVNSLPVDLVIKDLAHSLHLPYELRCREYSITLDEDIGSGYIKGMLLESGLGIIEYNCNFKKDIEIQFIKDKVHPLKFLYCVKGHFNHRFANEKQLHYLNEFQQAIVANHDNNGHVINFKKDEQIHLFSLEMDREQFKLYDECRSVIETSELFEVIEDTRAKHSFYYEGYYSLVMAEVFENIKNYDANYFLRSIFMISSGYQLLGSQISQYMDDQNNEDNRHVLRQVEVSKVKEAVHYIHENIERINTISDICEAVGLTEAKLQEGFKVFYNSTINHYINRTRLGLATQLLKSTEFNISEIVYKVGLTSRSYFSKIFKDEYNTTPTEFRKKYLGE